MFSLSRLWYRLELHHIEDAIADEMERERKHGRTLAMLYREAARLRCLMNDTGNTGTVKSLWPKDQ